MNHLCQILACVFVLALLSGCDSGTPKTTPPAEKVKPENKGATTPPLPPPPPLPGKS